MKRCLYLSLLLAITCCDSLVAKTLNPPSADIADIIKSAREQLDARHIDLSHRFLASVEYKNLESEYERPFWLLTWAPGGARGDLYVRIYNDGEIVISCADPRLCPPGV
jgi:hypothetical protein